MKIKTIFKNIFEKIKKIFKTYPITMTILYIITLIYFIFGYDYNEKMFNVLFNIYSILGLTFFGTLFSEIFYKDNKMKKYSLSSIAIIIAGLFNRLLEYNDKRIVSDFIIGYIILLLGLSLYKLIKNSEIDIKKFFINVCSKIFYTTIIYLVVLLGLNAIIFLLKWLIFTNSSFLEDFDKVLLVPFGIYFVPSVINILTNAKEIKVDNFIKSLVLYVLTPISFSALIIIYVYIIKIAIIHEMPENLIGRCLIGLFIFTIITYLMGSNYKEEKFGKLSNVLPIIYAPLMILEIYSILVRVFEYGLTPLRYLSVLFIVFEIAFYILNYYKKSEKLRILVIVGIIISMIYVVPPFNYKKVSNLSQKHILEKYIRNNTSLEKCTKEEKQKIIGAYDYLYYYGDEREYLNKLIKKEDIIKLRKENNDYNSNYYNTSLYYKDDINMIDIKEYSKMERLNSGESSNNINLKEIIFKICKENNFDDEKLKEYLNKKILIEIDNNKKLFITDLFVNYNNEDIRYFNVNGYIFEK